MARNRAFKRNYLIRFEGVTTNEFMATQLDSLFSGLAEALCSRYKQLRLVEFTATDSAKDPKKVKAGRKGGKLSGGNFKRNRPAARLAGQKSAQKRHGTSLEDYELEYEEMPEPELNNQVYESLINDEER